MSVRADRGRGARALRDIANGICVTCYGLVVYRVSDIYKREKRVLYYSIRSSLSARAPSPLHPCTLIEGEGIAIFV